ncbi:TetR/AcrR family transcriptional regulator [Nocardia callitridis]|uniref:TetR/AcrR family transcriptional regulator n=1 Tax=Nocardia callitridis TaxID=648753 RepID=A0ABP9JWU5_9NOCA
MTRHALTRRYTGLAPEERTRQRRGALLTAALELFGTAGYQPTAVKKLCLRAGLTERYFYESFTDREDCLAALYTALVDRLRTATADATALAAAANPTDLDAIAYAGLHGFVDYLTKDPRRARVVLIEVVGVSLAMEQRRHGVLQEFTDMVVAAWSAVAAARSPGVEVTTDRLTAVALVGGVNHLLVHWLMDGRRHDPAELTRTCVSLFIAAFDRARENRTHAR